MQDMLRKTQALTPTTLEARILAGSRYPTRYLTSRSRVQKETNLTDKFFQTKRLQNV